VWKEFRKKPIIVKAIRWDGNNLDEIKKLCKSHCHLSVESSNALVIKTLEGDMKCEKGNYVIQGVNGEFYPCKIDIFNRTYEEI